MASSKPYKILFLHGKGENRSMFAQRVARIESALGDSRPVECEYLSAPILIEGKDKFAWWKLPRNERSFTATEYIGIENSFELIESTWKSKGPFDCIVGHSQGAILTSILLARALVEDYPIKPEKAILMGAAWPQPFDKLVSSIAVLKLDKVPYCPRTLHVFALNDKVNPAEMALKIKNLLGHQAEALIHENGHDIPMDEDCLDRYRRFLFEEAL